ncbi:MAG TPA: cysteine desulfurase-like protein, partial [Thermoleophilaceae bacterium]|nr:cysteine desulfurase-like protein [Thermoleophilaceae bacterium]
MNRDRFPGLSDGWARFDAPAGSQPVDTAIEAMSQFMRSGAVANHGGAFEAAERTDALVDEARKVAGEFLGGEPRGVVFGPSMTSLTICFSAAIGRTLEPGDEIVCTRLDHDGNVAPWLIAAKRADVTVRFAEPDPETLDLPAGAVEAVLSDKTRWVAVTAASNAVGAVPDLEGIVKVAHQAGARVYIDAVHAAPHRKLDVSALDCDALVCSGYKWFGPHLSILWARPELLEWLEPDKLRPSPNTVPERWEFGTLPFESLAGLSAAARYVMDLGYDEIRAHEEALFAKLLEGLDAIEGITVHGRPSDRVPTLMLSVEDRNPLDVAKELAAEQVAVWHGNYYALEISTLLGLEPDGAIRAGIV